jgi:hypothetical protein
MIDFSKKYNRLFVIGCSFTNYHNWPTWAAALSVELDVPLYNLGHSGASNKYIQSQLFLLDSKYNLTSEDLVITQWSMHSRYSVLGDSFYGDSNEWKHWGNITDKSVQVSDKRKQEIAEITKHQTYNTLLLESLIAIKSSIIYQNTLQCTCINLQIEPMPQEMLKIRGKIMPSFVNVLFPGYDSYADVIENYIEIHAGNNKELSKLHSKYRKRNLLLKATKHAQRYDTHPLPTEHIAYLEEIFNQPFSDKVKQLAKDDEKKWFSNPVTSIAKNRDNTYYGLESLQQIVSLPG